MARILTVEHDPLQAIALDDEVTGLGHEVIGPASAVASALELINRKPPDLALIEVVVNGELTYPLARKLDARRIPFAFVTALRPANIRPQWRGRPLLPKPYNRQHLYRVLQNLSALVARF